MKIFFSVGEPSGDVHGANLVRQLQLRCPEVECVGYGGPRMARAGCRLQEDLTALAVMWFARVLWHLPRFWKLLRRADRYFAEHRPDAVVLIDYPGFNWWIARAARKHRIPVFYYGVPQIWAWAGWRIKKMRRLIDHALCKLPFEENWYRQRGCHAVYVGHPFFDETENHELDASLIETVRRPEGRLIAILPGSRTQEVKANLPWFLKAARSIRRHDDQARFVVASFNEKQAALARRLVGESGVEAEVYTGKTPELIAASECCLACSGSVSLELLYYARPSVILYHISPLAYFVQGFFRKVKYITLVNLLAADDLFPRDLRPFDPDQPGAESIPYPEYLTCVDKSERIAEHVIAWLHDPAQREQKLAQLRALKQRYARGGASAAAAGYIATTLGSQPRAMTAA